MEEFYRRLVDLLPDGLWIHRQGTIVFANRACATIFGAPSEEYFIGRQILEFIHPDDHEAVRRRLRQRMDEGGETVPRLDRRCIGLDGRIVYVDLVVNQVCYQGEPATQVLFRDISERRKAEERLRRSEANLAAAQQIARLGSWEMELSDPGRVEEHALRWSDEVFRIFGHEPGAVPASVGAYFDAVHPDDRARVQASFRQALEESASYSIEHRIVLPDESIRIVQAKADFAFDEVGRKTYRAVGTIQDITRQRQEEGERRQLAAIVENSADGIVSTSLDGTILSWNAGAERIHDFRRSEMIGTSILRLSPVDQPQEIAETLERIRRGESVERPEVTRTRRDGKKVTLSLMISPVRDPHGQVIGASAVFRDVTERKALEGQLRQAQKMEAVGRLAGGVAHDFNNLLSVIIGYSELLLDQLGEGSGLRRPGEQIKKAAERAAGLTRQLLAFSRQQVLEMRVLNLNAVVTEMGKMLPRLIGEDIELQLALADQLGAVRADPGQIEQVIMNLAVNSRDAMPEGGKLRIETRKETVDEEQAQNLPPMIAGEYVVLAMTDTGVGMDAATQAHIFEPFFTTKQPGRGTGLGLATVYGFVKQCGGYIWAYSEVGKGATFEVYLPCVAETVDARRESAGEDRLPRRNETVLLVEDEQSLRALTRTLLEQNGYAVLEADGGSAALEVARRHRGPIHVMLTDIVMPGMNGRALAEQLQSERPDVRIVYMSGYTGFVQRATVGSERTLLQKPFTRDALLRKLHDALELQEQPIRS